MLIFDDCFPYRCSVTFHHFLSPSVWIIRFDQPLDPAGRDRDSGRKRGGRIDLLDSNAQRKERERANHKGRNYESLAVVFNVLN